MYEFTGFFASPSVSMPADLPAGAVWRNIKTPFVGVGVRLEDHDGDSPLPSQDEVLSLLRKLKLSDAQQWLYLIYVCWGGPIDFVYGMGCRDGNWFGPAEACEMHEVDDVFKSLMNNFGVYMGDDIYFEPFVRGFWGQH